MRKKTPPKKIRVILTAGPTRAYLDRIRFLSNYSTGALGFALCKKLIAKKIDVYAVVGPTQQPFSSLKLKQLIEVETAEEMANAVLKLCKKAQPHYGIFSAAVLDFQPGKVQSGKVSSKRNVWQVRLVPTRKIIDEVSCRFPKVKKIGFKLEWKVKKGKDLERFASGIIEKKNLEALCVNFLPQIRGKRHPAWIFNQDRSVTRAFSKSQIATQLVRVIEQG